MVSKKLTSSYASVHSEQLKEWEMSENKKSSGLDKIAAVCAAFLAVLLFTTVSGSLSPSGGAGTMFVMIALTVGVFFITLRMLYIDPKVEELRLQQEESLKLQKNTLSEFVEKSKSFVSATFQGTYTGGSGNTFQEKDEVLIGCSTESLYLGNLTKLENINIKFSEITLFEISGAGTVTTNAGVVGGGFGVEGFIKGAIVAEVLNKVTEKSSTNTFIRVMTSSSEMYFHTSEREPAQLQILFSKIFVMLNASKNNTVSQTIEMKSVSEELTKLHSLFKDGVLTEAEFEQAKKNLIGS